MTWGKVRVSGCRANRCEEWCKISNRSRSEKVARTDSGVVKAERARLALDLLPRWSGLEVLSSRPLLDFAVAPAFVMLCFALGWPIGSKGHAFGKGRALGGR